MKCYYHPMNDSVAICPGCGRAGCYTCIHKSGDAIVCSSCMSNIVTRARTRFFIHLFFSTLLAVGGAWYGFYIGQSSKTVLDVGRLISMMAVLAYACWATYWGWGRVWRIWRKMTSGIGCASSVFLLPIILVIFFEIPLLFAYCYGFLGGGIFEFVKALLAARRKVNRPQQQPQSVQEAQQVWAQQSMQSQYGWQQLPLPQQWNTPSPSQFSQQWGQQPAPQPQFQPQWYGSPTSQFSQQWGQQPGSQPQFQSYWNAPSPPQYSEQWSQQSSSSMQEWGQSQQPYQPQQGWGQRQQ